MNQHRKTRFVLRLIGLALITVFAGASASAAGDTDAAEAPLHIGGFVRGWASVNLQDQPELKQSTSGKLSMLRGSIELDGDYKPLSTLRFKVIGRFDREYKTDYLKDLERPPSEKPDGSTAADFSTNAGGNIGGIMKNYNTQQFREWWGEWNASDRVKLKLGKQQVVWGETDFFRAMDTVHGFDFRWRTFLEVDNEELRKPLVIARAMIQVPEANGSIDAFIRPGWDKTGQIGNTYDLAGGRWAAQPTRGASFLYATAYNYRSEGADQDKATGGIRWQGRAGDFNYSVALLKTFNNDPVANPCPFTLNLLNSLVAGPGYKGTINSYQTFKQAPVACGAGSPNPFGNPLQFGDWIFPETTILGFTASTYFNAIDSVFATEIVYQKDRSFNYGFNGGRFGDNITPGAFGLIQKDTLTTMLRLDKQVNLAGLIGTSRPSFSSVQLFNTRILGFNRDDEIVQLAYWNRGRSQNSALLTGFIVMNYSNDRINPGFAGGWDVSYGGGFLIPSVEWVVGDNWRIKAELDLFFTAGNEKRRYTVPNAFPLRLEEQGKGAGLMGYFGAANQFVVRVTRQF